MPDYLYRCALHGDVTIWFPMGEAVASLSCGDECEAIRVYTMPLISEAALPNRTEGRRQNGSGAPPAGNNNSWEKGIARDERGMPFLGGDNLTPIGVKEYARRRHEIEEHRRMLRQAPPVPTPERDN